MNAAVQRKVIDSDGGRKADLASIHIAKKDLGWDDGTYRDVMFSVCRVKSSADLDFASRKRFLAHLRACGWSGGTKAAAASKPGAAGARKPLTKPQRLMWSLWQQLADADKVNDRKMSALVAFVKRHTGVAKLEWLKPEQESLAIEGLKAWKSRAGAPQP